LNLAKRSIGDRGSANQATG